MLHLSAPQGGVRVSDAIARELWRFELTCYFVLKHRGLAGLLPFAWTFGLIGLVRLARWRRPAAARALWEACRRGWKAWKSGPDQTIPALTSAGIEASHGAFMATRDGRTT